KRNVTERVEVKEESKRIGVQFAEVSEDEYQPMVPKEEELAEATKTIITATLDSKPVEAPSAAPVETAPSRTEEMLAELALTLGSQSIQNQIKVLIDEEFEKRMGSVSMALAAATKPNEEAYESARNTFEDRAEEPEAQIEAEAEETEEAQPIGNIFGMAAAAEIDEMDEEEEESINNEIQSEITDDADAKDEGSYYDEDEINVLSFLKKQAAVFQAAKEGPVDNTITDFINSLETVLDVTLEQLINYNKQTKEA
ncbi:MAG: hypothetical protein Q4E99_04315, partial [Bacillota bacterium]|nr:hypothetical protein [Bacillota bacterium]